MLPGAGAQVYDNEAGEPLGWDYPPDPSDRDLDELYDEEDADREDDDPPETLVVCDRCGDESDSWPGLICGRVEEDPEGNPQGDPCSGIYRRADLEVE